MKQWLCRTFTSANKHAPGLPKGTCHDVAGYGVFLPFCDTADFCQHQPGMSMRKEGGSAQCTSAWINSAVAIYTGKKSPLFTLCSNRNAELCRAGCKEHVAASSGPLQESNCLSGVLCGWATALLPVLPTHAPGARLLSWLLSSKLVPNLPWALLSPVSTPCTCPGICLPWPPRCKGRVARWRLLPARAVIPQPQIWNGVAPKGARGLLGLRAGTAPSCRKGSLRWCWRCGCC